MERISVIKNKQAKLGLLECSTILIGGMIGGAIFSLSGVTITGAGPAALLSWFVAGVIQFGYGLLNAELSTLYPNSGGVFVFPSKALGKTPEQGRFWGWMSSWMYLCACLGGVSFSAVYVGTYLGVAFPALAAWRVPIALLATVICGTLNALKISVTGKISIVLTGSLVVTLLIYIVTGMSGNRWDTALLTPFFTQGANGSYGWLSAIPLAMVAYGSIVAVAFMVGEIREAEKNVPRSMVIAMTVVVSLYVLVLLTTLGLVTAGHLQAHADLSYVPLFAAAFVRLSHISWLPALIAISATLALHTNMMVLIAIASRTLQAAAQAGIVPAGLGKNHERTGSPLHATMLVTAIIAALVLFPGITEFIINMGALCNVIVISIICITVITARKKAAAPAAFRAPGGDILPLLMLVVFFLCYIPQILSGNVALLVFAALFILAGIIIFRWGSGRRRLMDAHESGRHESE